MFLKQLKILITLLSKKLKNFDVHEPEKIDKTLIELDGTKQKSKLGANSILAVSIAVLR